MHISLSYRKIGILLVPLLVLWIGINASGAVGSGTVFSLDAKSMPLGEVLKRISSLSGCEVAADESWLDIPVTVHLDNVDLRRALERVLASLGNPDHIVVTKGSRVELVLCAFASENLGAGIDGAGHKSDIPAAEELHARLLQIFLDEELPTGDEPGYLLGEGAIDPLDLEVIPPEKPGGKGITERELIAINARQKEIDPLDLEVIPPVKPGEKGVTERELIAMHQQQKQIAPPDSEMISPE